MHADASTVVLDPAGLPAIHATRLAGEGAGLIWGSFSDHFGRQTTIFALAGVELLAIATLWGHWAYPDTVSAASMLGAALALGSCDSGWAAMMLALIADQFPSRSPALSEELPGQLGGSARSHTTNGNVYNMFLLSISLFLIFASYNTIQDFASTILDEPGFPLGTVATCLLYVIFSLANFISPTVVQALGEVRAMGLAAFTYFLYACSLVYIIPVLVLLASVGIGLGAAVLWTAEGSLYATCAPPRWRGLWGGVIASVAQGWSLLPGNILSIFLYASCKSVSDEGSVSDDIPSGLLSAPLGSFPMILFCCTCLAPELRYTEMAMSPLLYLTPPAPPPGVSSAVDLLRLRAYGCVYFTNSVALALGFGATALVQGTSLVNHPNTFAAALLGSLATAQIWLSCHHYAQAEVE
eukprot:gene10431-277_t